MNCVALQAQSLPAKLDTICVKKSEYKELLNLAVDGLYCDSLLTIREAQFSELSELLDLTEATIRSQDAELRKYQRRQKWGRVVVGSLIAAVLVEGLVIVALK